MSKELTAAQKKAVEDLMVKAKAKTIKRDEMKIIIPNFSNGDIFVPVEVKSVVSDGGGVYTHLFGWNATQGRAVKVALNPLSTPSWSYREKTEIPRDTTCALVKFWLSVIAETDDAKFAKLCKEFCKSSYRVSAKREHGLYLYHWDAE